MIVDALSYYRMTKESNIDIIYSGPLWADGIEGIAGTLRKRLEIDDLPMTMAHSIFSVFVEQMNNMLMYSAEKQMFSVDRDTVAEASVGVFILGAKDRKYFLQSGNVMKSDSAEAVREKIDHLNTLDKAQLRQYYKEQIKGDNPNPESRGAGLGLIEIARRTSSKIEYDFVPLEDGTTFFSMYVTIG